MTKKERQFCQCYLSHFDVVLAAKQAGYDTEKQPEICISLLEKGEISAYIKAHFQKEEELLFSRVLLFAKKIMESNISDVIYFTLHKDTIGKQELGALNLLPISELKIKGESVEVKFYDKVKLITFLLSLKREETPTENGFLQNFLDALTPENEAAQCS